MSRRRASARKPHGWIRDTGPWGEISHGDTLSCCHCRAHWIVEKGSGRERGWCWNCGGPTCGDPQCLPCIPFEQQLENVEAGRDRLAPRPVKVLVEGLPPAAVLLKILTPPRGS